MLFTAEDHLNVHTHFKPGSGNEFIVRNAYLRLSSLAIDKLGYHVSCGLHPWHVNRMTADECGDALIECASSSRVLAIGEIGVDKAIDIPLKKQLEYFELQLNIARAFRKPVIIHAVRSYHEILPFLKKTRIPFIFHGFSGNAQQARELLKYPCKLSFGKNLFEAKAREVLRTLPDDGFLLETDSAPGISIHSVYEQAALARKVNIVELKSTVFHTFASVIKAEPLA